jgi:hypothetical protein
LKISFVGNTNQNRPGALFGALFISQENFMEEKTIVLEATTFEDLQSPEPERRKKALQILSRNEDKLFGSVTRQTVEALQGLEQRK